MNLLPNPGAEIDSTSQWQAYTGPGSGAVRSTAKAHTGTASFLATVDASDASTVIGWYTASPPRADIGSPETFSAGFWITENSGGGQIRAYLKVWANGFASQRTAPAQLVVLTSGWQFITFSIATEPGDVVNRADITFDLIDAMPTVSFHVDDGYIRDATSSGSSERRIRSQFQLRPY